VKRIENREIITDDRLKLVVRDRTTGKLYTQGKRVRKDCPLRRSEIRTYVEDGVVAAMRIIQLNRGGNLRACRYLLDMARYGSVDSYNPEGL